MLAYVGYGYDEFGYGSSNLQSKRALVNLYIAILGKNSHLVILVENK